MSAWTVIRGAVVDSGDIGGDGQITWAPSVRLHLTADPRSLITISYYGQHRDPNRESPDGELELCEHVEMMVCRDPEDPGGTEEWCDYRYTVIDAELPRRDLNYRALIHAEWMAKRPGTPDLIRWDGRPHWNGQADPLSDERFAVYERIAERLG